MTSDASSLTDFSANTTNISAHNVIAVLGPTNTGKTHLAIERMLGHQTGLIGLPLRLLAREVYDKIIARVNPSEVALITGEERIKPANARYFVCTVEAMPRDISVDFLAIDEVQLAADPERGHIFTDRLLHARGQKETLLLGAATMRGAITDLLPGCNFISRPRLSKLTYAGEKKITRLPRRSAVVAFSANDVYEIAELIRRQRGGAAVVLGALSPRTRNAQVALYQSGDVDYIVATDAIGMGLNLDVNHVAFAGTRKYDGQLHRELTPAELGQIAGRAGRHTNDGTFGVTGSVEPFVVDLIEKMENHDYESLKVLQWRNPNLSFSSLDALKTSLKDSPSNPRLVRARMADDAIALENVTLDSSLRDMARSPAALRLLWDACQTPDYRKISSSNHADLISTLYKFLMSEQGKIPENWFAEQVAHANSTEGDIDTLANRIAHIRTWTFISNRHDWLGDPVHWQERTREIEDILSDALHEKLTARFVDQRTSVLIKRLQDSDDMLAEIADDGAIVVENHYVGRIEGFRFSPDPKGEGIHVKAVRNAAAKVLVKEMAMRVRRVSSAKSDAFSLNKRGRIVWKGDEIARLEKGEHPLKPNIHVLCDEHLSAPERDKVAERLEVWLSEQVDTRLQPLSAINKATDITGLARGIAFQLVENFGILKRDIVMDEIKSLDQTSRGQLRKYGVRFGAFNIYFPLLLKPAASELLLILWTLTEGEKHELSLDKLPEPPRAGLTSVPAEHSIPEGFYKAAGYQRCGRRAVRIDMLERLADMIRPLTSWRMGHNQNTSQANTHAPTEMPKGASGDGGFIALPEMMSIMGCSGEELGSILRSLGFRSEMRLAEKIEQIRADAKAQVLLAQASSSDLPNTTTASPHIENAEQAETTENVVNAETSATTTSTIIEAIATGPDVSSADQDKTPLIISEAPAKTEMATPSESAIPEGSVSPETASEPLQIEIWLPQKRKNNSHHAGHHTGHHTGQGERKFSKKKRSHSNFSGDAKKQGFHKGSRDQAKHTPAQNANLQATSPQGASLNTMGQPSGEVPTETSPENRERKFSHGQQNSQNNKHHGQGRDHRGKGRNDFKKGDYKKGGYKKSDFKKNDYQKSASPKQAKKGIDPDSPFAALSQLKKALESQSGK